MRPVLNSIAQKVKKFEQEREKYAVRVYDLGEEREISFGRIPDPSLDRSRREDLEAEERERRDRENKERSVRRAKKKLRHKVLSGNLRYMWSLTYEQNMQDRKQAECDWRNFVRRLEYERGEELRFCKVLERQERGAWHIHFATNERIDWELLGEVWGHGYVYVTDKSGHRWRVDCGVKAECEWMPVRAACYLAKYLEKEWESLEGTRKKLYTCSKGIRVRRAEMRVKSLEDVMRIVRSELEYVGVSIVESSWERGWFASWDKWWDDGEKAGKNVEAPSETSIFGRSESLGSPPTSVLTELLRCGNLLSKC